MRRGGEWTAEQRDRVGKLIARFGDANDGELLAAARALARTVDPLELGTFICEAELPEPADGPLAKILRRMLDEIRSRVWSLKSGELATFNDLQAKFLVDGGRLGSIELARLDKLYVAARRRA